MSAKAVNLSLKAAKEEQSEIEFVSFLHIDPSFD
jgi:hypothetical protein